MDGFVIDLQVFCANFCIIPIGKGGKYENENQNKYAAISLLATVKASQQKALRLLVFFIDLQVGLKKS